MEEREGHGPAATPQVAEGAASPAEQPSPPTSPGFVGLAGHGLLGDSCGGLGSNSLLGGSGSEGTRWLPPGGLGAGAGLVPGAGHLLEETKGSEDEPGEDEPEREQDSPGPEEGEDRPGAGADEAGDEEQEPIPAPGSDADLAARLQRAGATASVADLRQLRAIVGDRPSDDALAWLLRCQGDLEGSAIFAVDNDVVAWYRGVQERAREAERQRAAAQAADEEAEARAKARVLEQYDERAERTGNDGRPRALRRGMLRESRAGGRAKALGIEFMPLARARSGPKRKKEAQMRYRDGQAVGRMTDRFVTEKPPSQPRGAPLKVITKGKRGAGVKYV